MTDNMSRADYIRLATDEAEAILCDDALYPQTYLERIARRDHQVVADFADDFVNGWDDILAEADEQNIGFTSTDLYDIAEQTIKEAFFEWSQLSADEQKSLIDIDELDDIRSKYMLSR